jgi:hypothetical protein
LLQLPLFAVQLACTLNRCGHCFFKLGSFLEPVSTTTSRCLSSYSALALESLRREFTSRNSATAALALMLATSVLPWDVAYRAFGVDCARLQLVSDRAANVFI